MRPTFVLLFEFCGEIRPLGAALSLDVRTVRVSRFPTLSVSSQAGKSKKRSENVKINA